MFKIWYIDFFEDVRKISFLSKKVLNPDENQDFF